MYEDQTYEVILQRMLDNLSDDIDKREGSVAFDMLAPKAAELSMAYIELDNVLNFGFAGTTYGEFLDLKVGEVGLTRLSSIKASGLITFSSLIEGKVIPQGTIVYTDSGIQFTTDYQTSIYQGAATVSITSVEGGNAYNVPSSTIINTELADVTCTNNNPTSNGSDEETDASLLLRYYAKIQSPVTSGNANHYKAWAKEVTGIGDAKVFPLWNGNGTVKVIVIGTDKRAVISAKVTEVLNHINDSRPIGPTITVESGVEKLINISAHLTLATNFTIADVQSEIQAGLDLYLKGAAFVDPDVKYSKIGNILLGVNGVLDYSSLTVNGGSTNIVLGSNETPVLGTVTLS